MEEISEEGRGQNHTVVEVVVRPEAEDNLDTTIKLGEEFHHLFLTWRGKWLGRNSKRYPGKRHKVLGMWTPRTQPWYSSEDNQKYK